jgi:UDP-N-acetylglucosamine acyltransferase
VADARGLGDHNLIMAYTHIAHDCQIGSHIIMANAATLGGHVTVGDWANGGGAVSGASLRADWGACFYRRRNDNYARCAAVFEDVGGARDAGLWIECGGAWSGGDLRKNGLRKLHHAYKRLLASKLNTAQALEKLKAEADRGGCGDADSLH